MNIIISGYGRMGKAVEQICLERKHHIIAKIDTRADWDRLEVKPGQQAVVIDFSLPETAISNINTCFDKQLPLVMGTTGWYDQLEKVRKTCKQKNGTLLYAPNFSLGVNILFHVNALLAKIMAKTGLYQPEITEIHHIHKLDAPSGTALRLAEDILNAYPQLHQWVNHPATNQNELGVISKRMGEVPGTHHIVYQSDVDEISLSHEAKSRKGFALGAVLAAEFIQDKKGIFTMQEMLQAMGI